MTDRPIRDLSASVHARLLNLGRASGRPFQELLQHFAMERFLYRLSCSPQRGRFVLKGALLLTAWDASQLRPTRDIDLLGELDNDVEAVAAVVRELCVQAAEQDGLSFDPATVVGERIAEEAVYGGVRVRFRGHLGRARIPMQVDVGFGDVVVPAPRELSYPTLLDFPAPRLRGYPKESVVAEKLHTMVRRGMLNSRMRDFHDVWFLSRRFGFDGGRLRRAVDATFRNRDTAIPTAPVALSEAFGSDPGKQVQWRAFLRRTGLPERPTELAIIVAETARFLVPVLGTLTGSGNDPGSWEPGGPWKSKR